jgi:hypothetical protein
MKEEIRGMSATEAQQLSQARQRIQSFKDGKTCRKRQVSE